MQTTVLIAGAESAVGRALVREFARQGHDVRATLSPHAGSSDGRGSLAGEGGDQQVQRYTVDWRNPDGTEEAAVEGARMVVDATGVDAGVATGSLDDALRAGVAATRNVMAAAEGHRAGRVVHVAEAMVLGTAADVSDVKRVRSESDDYRPGAEGRGAEWPPAAAAYAAQMEAYRFVERGLPVTIAIPGLAVGPRGIDTTLGRLLERVWTSRLPFGLGGTINLIDGRDVARSIVELASQGRPGRRFILGGHDLKVTTLLERAVEIGGGEVPERRLPDGLIEHGGRLAEGMIGRLGEAVPMELPTGALEQRLRDLRRIRRATGLSSERASNELGHRPRPLRRTLNDTFEWWSEDRSIQ